MDDQDVAIEGGRRLHVRLIAGVLAAVAIVLFVVQNTAGVPVRFLWFEGDFPLFLLLLITIALTVILGLGMSWFMRRRAE